MVSRCHISTTKRKRKKRSTTMVKVPHLSARWRRRYTGARRFRYPRRQPSSPRTFYEFLHYHLHEFEYLSFRLFAVAAIVTILWWALIQEHRVLDRIASPVQTAAASDGTVSRGALEATGERGQKTDLLQPARGDQQRKADLPGTCCMKDACRCSRFCPKQS
jgi:hypothetical protein